jgi:hypothetical protein
MFHPNRGSTAEGTANGNPMSKRLLGGRSALDERRLAHVWSEI